MLKAHIISCAGDRATLSFLDSQTFSVPLSAIEGAVKEGSEVALVIAALGSEDAGRQRLARDLLTDLFSG